MRWAALATSCLLAASVAFADAGTDTPAVPAADTDAATRTATLSAKSKAMLGDKITVTLAVTVPEGDDVGVPEQSFAPFEMLDDASNVTAEPGGTQRFNFTLDLIAFEAGVHALGPLDVRITTADGELVTIETNAVDIEIASLIANEPNPTLKPETEPVTVMQDDYTLAWVLGALGAMLLGGLLTWLFLRWWRQRERPEPEPPPPPPPWEIALRELRQIERQRLPLLGQGNLVQWVDMVSDVIRKYLGARFGFDGLESTTDEIIAHLREAKLQGIATEDALTFLSECDLVKFAKAPMAESATETLLQNAFTMIERTRGGASASVQPPPPSPPPSSTPPPPSTPPSSTPPPPSTPPTSTPPPPVTPEASS